MTTPTQEQVEALARKCEQWTVFDVAEALRALLAETGRQAAEVRDAHIRTEEIRDTLAEVVTGEHDTPTMAVLAVAEVKRLREDAARLDWLEDYGLTITLDPGHKVIGPDRGHIDAARREGGA